MAKSEWFETVAEAQRRAKKRLPKSVYSALVAGSERGVSVDDNVASFAELGFAPHTAGLSGKRDLSTTVMGQPISLPVFISPTGVQAVHPDGEVAVARAAAARGTAMSLSSFASKSIEEVAAANPQTFFQMYWTGGRDKLLARMERARAAGAVGLVITTDRWVSYRRPDHHHRLVVLLRPRLGQPENPGEDGPARHVAVRPGGHHPAGVAARF